MPAVTPPDILVLPRLPTPIPSAEVRKVRRLTTAPRGYEGEGFPVRRAFAGVSHSELDPFLHLDQMGEVDYAPGEPRGTAWHPHRGFETVTYMIDGTMDHRDSHGGGGRISDGDTQWMTAGGGILHIETPPEKLVMSGGLFHGMQLWVNLPRTKKMSAPRYQDIRGKASKLLATPDGGGLLRVIAGEIAGHRGPGSTQTPITLAHVTLQPGARLDLPWRRDHNALIYAMSGKGSTGADRRPLRSGQLATFWTGDTLRAEASGPRPLELFVMGGRPIGEPVAMHGPFVMTTRAELATAWEDWKKGRLGVVPAKRISGGAPRRKR
ncbi:pirin family protein [Catenuloplanes japonicus]|uniref:pirin family protein n=1 Tax=Catenuloplanes japonicus TaxID=33876 RepID=UPI000524D613|nr:pirin family protein [Catenuloplanes japonicus]